ncbi:50S ribosomal protein L18 [Corynebacterium diphtheriae]
MISKIDKNKVRLKRHARVRTKLSGTAEKPRLNVYRSNKHIYAQIIDDVKGVTLAQASSQDKDIANTSASKVDLATTVGQEIAKKANDKGIKEIVFDRGGYLYHGRVKSFSCQGEYVRRKEGKTGK